MLCALYRSIEDEKKREVLGREEDIYVTSSLHEYSLTNERASLLTDEVSNSATSRCYVKRGSEVTPKQSAGRDSEGDILYLNCPLILGCYDFE